LIFHHTLSSGGLTHTAAHTCAALTQFLGGTHAISELAVVAKRAWEAVVTLFAGDQFLLLNRAVYADKIDAVIGVL
jgi:hypothetical protein